MVGTFGYNMIVTCEGAGVWEVDSTGSPTLIADTMTDLEGPAIVPLNFGPLRLANLNSIKLGGTTIYNTPTGFAVARLAPVRRKSRSPKGNLSLKEHLLLNAYST